MSLQPIVSALGGDLYDRGRRANIPAPGHSAADRSVSLVLSQGRVVVHSFSDTDWREVLDDLRRRGLLDAVGAPRSGWGRDTAARDQPPSAPQDRTAAARRIWDEGGAVGPATLSARHAHLRRVTRPLPGGEVLRHHSEAPLSVYRPGRRALPALLAAISDAAGRFSGVEITYIGPNGRRATGLYLSRKTVGAVPPASAVRLDPAAEEMLVAEGVFTTLSATERFGLPGWALMSTRNLRSWRPPEGVRRVLIAADRGRDGQASAALLAARLRAAGLSAAIRTPAPPDGDWNETAVRLRSAAR